MGALSVQIEIFDGHSDLLTELATTYRLTGQVDFQSKYLTTFQQGCMGGSIFVAWADNELAIPLAKQIEDIFTVEKLLAEKDDTLWRVETHQDLVSGRAQGKICYLLGLEGLDGLEEKPQLLAWLRAQGVRHLGLTWNEDNAFAGGALSKTGQGLTTRGKNLVQEAEKRYSFLLDVSHLNEASFWDVLKLVQEPLIASHSNSYTLCPVPRNLRDEQLRALASVGGVVGVNSYPPFVDESRTKQNLQRLADHVEYMVELMGIDHVGCGFDYNYWDADDNKVVLPELAHVGESQNLLQELQKRGYRQEDLQKIGSQNFLRVITERLNGEKQP